MRDFVPMDLPAAQGGGYRPSGIKAIRHMRAPTPTFHNSRQTKKITDTQNYFLEKVDPLIGECIAHLILKQPADIPKAMLNFFMRKKGLETIEDPSTDAPSSSSSRPRKEQKLYLATSIGPVVAKLINRIAVTRPDNVLDYICTELVILMDEPPTSDAPSIPKEPEPPSRARNRLNDARVLADTVSAPLPEVSSGSTTRTRIEEAKAMAKSIVETSLERHLSPRKGGNVGGKSIVTASIEAHTATRVAAAPALQSSEPKSIQIALLGLGGAGKSSMINMLQGNFDPKVRPTIGFRPITMMLGEDAKVRFYDLGGGPKIRSIWDQYYHDVHAVVYVVDASASQADHDEAIAVFKASLHHPFLAGKPLLVVANKQDKAGAMNSSAVEASLGLSSSPATRSKVVGSTAIVPGAEGTEVPLEMQLDPRLEEGLEWLLKAVQSSYDALNERVDIDTKRKASEEAKKRLERERKVLKNKIAAAFLLEVDPALAPPDTPANPEDAFTEQEGLTFLASEIGEEVVALSPVAVDICALIGYQRLALQIVGALYAPINRKKKTPLSWGEILELVTELRTELGMSARIR